MNSDTRYKALLGGVQAVRFDHGLLPIYRLHTNSQSSGERMVMEVVEAEDGRVCCTLWRDLHCFHHWHNLFCQQLQRFPIVAKE